MNRQTKLLIAMLAAVSLVAAACGDSDEPDATGATAASSTAAPTTAAPTTAAPTTAAPTTAAPTTTQPIEIDPFIEQFDANGDGTITIGVAAAGPRDDNGYYQSLVNFAEEFSAENGFAPPIVVDNIGAAEAAQAMADLAQQGVDIMMVGASEIAEPLPDLTAQFPDIFWYCNCGAGFERTSRFWPRQPTGALPFTTPPVWRWVPFSRSRAEPRP